MMDELTQAKLIATTYHDKQRYQEVLPYTHHLQEVEYVLRRFDEPETNPTNPDLFVAAWLHDTLEDTSLKARNIEELFGEDIAALVVAVTDEDWPSRAVRKAMTYPKILAGGKDAVRLKLADRIANIEGGGKGFKMYKAEHETFKRSLYTKGENEDMWDHLDALVLGKL